MVFGIEKYQQKITYYIRKAHGLGVEKYQQIGTYYIRNAYDYKPIEIKLLYNPILGKNTGFVHKEISLEMERLMKSLI